MHPAACVRVRAVDYAEFKTYENLFSRYFGQLCENLHQRKFPAMRYYLPWGRWMLLELRLNSSSAHDKGWLTEMMEKRRH